MAHPCCLNETPNSGTVCVLYIYFWADFGRSRWAAETRRYMCSNLWISAFHPWLWCSSGSVKATISMYPTTEFNVFGWKWMHARIFKLMAWPFGSVLGAFWERFGSSLRVHFVMQGTVQAVNAWGIGAHRTNRTRTSLSGGTTISLKFIVSSSSHPPCSTFVCSGSSYWLVNWT